MPLFSFIYFLVEGVSVHLLIGLLGNLCRFHCNMAVIFILNCFCRSCYKSSLSLLSAHGFHSIAFPCISTGMYQYPSLEAADIALSTVREWLLDKDNLDNVDRVVFVTRSTKNEELYSLLMLVYFPLV